MIKIRVIEKETTTTDEAGNIIPGTMLMPETPIPSNCKRVECDGQFYTVYEEGDV
ncbi:MAG: hypothetical protein HY890_07960 [Deltaproteobacteria bacterium]|nr:hypothetical protein [Deltaproteobacteria bacterium]